MFQTRYTTHPMNAYVFMSVFLVLNAAPFLSALNKFLPNEPRVLKSQKIKVQHPNKSKKHFDFLVA